MKTIVINKEKNTLTITVNGNRWNCANYIKAGAMAGKTVNTGETLESNRKAINAAKKHAKLNS
jgi:hypothetical protein